MSTIVLQNLSFGYPAVELFHNLNLLIDTRWSTAVVGRNGRGKTTLLKLILGELEPDQGSVSLSCKPCLYSNTPGDSSQALFDVALDAIAPFRQWEVRMQELLERGDDASLADYGAVLETYQARGGYTIRARLGKELSAIGIPNRLWQQAFNQLSGGEQTRTLIASMFANSVGFPLIDEPTNHLDMAARKHLAGYLASRPGFLLVSHDRNFLDQTTNHVLAILPSGVTLDGGGYTHWRERFLQQQETEAAQNEQLKREIASLSHSAGQRRQGAEKRERDKGAHTDKGYIGHMAAKQMKRALALERRVGRNIEQRKQLLNDQEKIRDLKLSPTSGRKVLLQVTGLTVQRGGRRLLENFDFVLQRGERIAISGPNGCGKTSLLDELEQLKPPSVTCSRGYQIPLWRSGCLREHLRKHAYDEARFCQILGVLGVGGDILQQALESLSQGQLKKIDLTRTFCTPYTPGKGVGALPADFILWDEPLNYLDIEAREQLEAVILKDKPTLIFIEHDERFVENVATRVVNTQSVMEEDASK